MAPPLDAARWRQLSAWLDALDPLDAPARERRLQDIAADDPEAAAQLRDLLLADAAARQAGFLGGLADPTTGAAALQPGDRLGPWTLLQAVGEGGMGEVWRARRSDGRYDGDAAIKFLKAGPSDARLQARFRREGALLARLRHPGIAQLLDAGLTDSGRPYLVLEWVDGQRIDHWCDAAGLGIDARLRLALQVLAAVSAAHGQLVIHRDLKPSNILVDGQGVVKLLDFGIARLLDEDTEPGLTRDGLPALTPGYAAPEQYTQGALGVATDVYALGVVLFELLTGQHPSGLQGATHPLAYLRAATDSPHRRASTACRSPADARGLAGDLDDILACALAPDPARRYASVQAMADDLQRHRDHRPIAARRAGWAERAGLFVRRNRLLVALGGVAGLAVVAGVAGTLAMAWRAEKSAALAQAEQLRADVQARDAVAQRDRALDERDKAQRLGELFLFISQNAFSGPNHSIADALQRSIDYIDQRPGMAPAHRAELLATLAEHMTSVDQWQLIDRALQRAQVHAAQASDRGVRADVACNLAGLQATHRAEFAAARQTLAAALAQLPPPPLHLASRIHCLQVSEAVAREAGDSALAVTDIEQALRLDRQLAVGGLLAHHDNLQHAAMAYQFAGQVPAALRSYEAAGQLLPQLQLVDTASEEVLNANWASLWFYAGRPLDGMARTRRARHIRNAGQGESPTALTGMTFDDIALHQLGQLPQALAYADRLVAQVDRSGHRLASNLVRLNRVPILRDLGRLDEAEALIGTTLKRLATLPPANYHFGVLRAEQGLIAAKRGQPAMARRLLDEAVAMLQASSNAALFLPPVLLRRAELRLAQGRADEADADAQDAQQRLTTVLGPQMLSLHHGDALMLRGQVAARQGRAADAQQHFGAAARHYADSLGPQHAKTLQAARRAAQPAG